MGLSEVNILKLCDVPLLKYLPFTHLLGWKSLKVVSVVTERKSSADLWG